MKADLKSSAPFVLILLLAAAPVLADEITGSDKMLCASRGAAVCTPADCETISLDEFNIPDFVELDLTAKQLRTTAASGETRITPIQTVAREDGNLYLQGVEMGRAWSFLIVEETGRLTFSVAREELSVTVFGACTPWPAASR